MKCFEKTCGNLWVLESYEIIFNGMETENIDAAIPDRTLVNDSCVQGKMTDNDDTKTLVLQTEGVLIYLFGILSAKIQLFLKIARNPTFLFYFCQEKVGFRVYFHSQTG